MTTASAAAFDRPPYGRAHADSSEPSTTGMGSSTTISSAASTTSTDASPPPPHAPWRNGSLFSPPYHRHQITVEMDTTVPPPNLATRIQVISAQGHAYQVADPVAHTPVILDLLSGRLGPANAEEPATELDKDSLRDLSNELECLRLQSIRRSTFNHSFYSRQPERVDVAKTPVPAQSLPPAPPSAFIANTRDPSPTCRVTDVERERIKAQQRLSDKVKTVLCTQYMKMGRCDYGSACRFAHGYSELRLRKVPANYKTVLCQNFERDGFCRYGKRCQFIHRTASQSDPDEPKPAVKDVDQAVLSSSDATAAFHTSQGMGRLSRSDKFHSSHRAACC